MDLLNIMVLLSIKNQAGPAQDPWPPKPKPSRSGPGPLARQAGPARDPWPPKPIELPIALPRQKHDFKKVAFLINYKMK